MKPLATSLLMAFLFPLSLEAAESSAEELKPAWHLGAQGLFGESVQALPETATGEEAVFTRAVLLLNRQPRTEADLLEAIGMLRDLGENGSSDGMRARSLYYGARAESFRVRGESVSLLSQQYNELWRRYPDQFYGQRALVHVLLLAFDLDASREEILAKCESIEHQASALTDRMVRSHFHQVAARGYLSLGGAETRALEHLLQAHELGVARQETRGDLHVSIGQLAAEQGRLELAQKHYREFIRLFPHDPRTYTINVYLEALGDE